MDRTILNGQSLVALTALDKPSFLTSIALERDSPVELTAHGRSFLMALTASAWTTPHDVFFR